MDPKTIETDARGAQPGEVVQINPEKHPKFAGCFAVVDQLRRWGVVADIPMPGDPNAIIPVRLAWADFARVGMACWVRAGLCPECQQPLVKATENAGVGVGLRGCANCGWLDK